MDLLPYFEAVHAWKASMLCNEGETADWNGLAMRYHTDNAFLCIGLSFMRLLLSDCSEALRADTPHIALIAFLQSVQV